MRVRDSLKLTRLEPATRTGYINGFDMYTFEYTDHTCQKNIAGHAEHKQYLECSDKSFVMNEQRHYRE